MRAQIAEAAAAFAGLARIALGQPGYEAKFDVSAEGFQRSFLAAGLALAPYAFVIAAQRHLASTGLVSELEPVSTATAALIYAVIWLHFPIIAYVFVKLTARPTAFSPWTVAHNWLTLLLLLIQSVPWILLTAGALNFTVFTLLLETIQFFGLFMHVRVAIVALGRPWGLALAGALAHVLVLRISQLLILQAA